jgi:hypothetical protein
MKFHIACFHRILSPFEILTLASAPARSSMTYSPQTGYSADHHTKSAYAGYPNESNNKAWEELIYRTYISSSSSRTEKVTELAMFFNATATEVLKAGNSISESVLLAEGGYVSALGVYHELHCLVSLPPYPPLPNSSTVLPPSDPYNHSTNTFP